MAKRVGYKIFVDKAEKLAFDNYLKSVGIEHNQAVTRMVRWLMSSDAVLRMGILELYDESQKKEIVALSLARLGGFEAEPSRALLDAATTVLTEISARQAARESAAAPESPGKKRKQDPPHTSTGAA